MRQGFSRVFRGVIQAGCIASLNFSPQRGPLAVGNRRIKWRGGLASIIRSIDSNIHKSRSIQFRADAFYIVVAMRGAGHETRGIMRKESCQRFRHDISKLVF